MPGIKIISASNLEAAVQLMRDGGVLVFPTETSYALGCDATNAQAVAQVFAIKGRPTGKGTPLILPPQAAPGEYVEWSEAAQTLADKFWPGPLNIVLPGAETSPVSDLCATQGTLCVRQSSHPIANQLAALLGRPLVATSANRSGVAAAYTVAQLLREFAQGLGPGAVLDAGDLPVVPASTTVSLVGDEVIVLRQGAVIL
ncbi:MAG: L-threonylcarbamoyladenylate synthase [Patescibacteria group bacterium]